MVDNKLQNPKALGWNPALTVATERKKQWQKAIIVLKNGGSIVVEKELQHPKV